MIWIWIDYMRDINESVDDKVEIDFKPLFLRFESIKYQSSINLFKTINNALKLTLM